MELSAAGANEWGRKLEIPIGFLGFWAGVDQGFQNLSNNAGTAYPYTTQGFGDLIAQLAGNSTAKKLIPSYAGSANGPSFKPFNFITNNKALLPGIALWALNEFGGSGFGTVSKVIKVAHTYGMPYVLGYSVGVEFDPAPGDNLIGAIQTYGTASAAQAQAASYFNNLLSAGQ